MTDHGVVVPTMTVNHVLKIHPRAREIFVMFHVDCEIEGLHCLDELPWRRGIDVAALLHELNKPVTELEVAGLNAGGVS